MAPLKFEEHLKEQLDKREIRPSAGSWEELSSRLDEVENRMGRKWWIPAAAAVAVIAIASLIFIDQQNESAAPVVENPVEIRENAPEDPGNFEQPVQVASEEKEDIQGQKMEEVKSPKFEKEEISKERFKEGDGQLAQNLPEKRIILEPVSLEPPKEDAEDPGEFAGKVNELLTIVAQQEKRNGDISEAEVNQLLAQAAREISEKRNYTEGDVSAEALLADVEFEMDQSFRQEVFEVLKEGFMKARTAIATRNE